MNRVSDLHQAPGGSPAIDSRLHYRALSLWSSSPPPPSPLYYARVISDLVPSQYHRENLDDRIFFLSRVTSFGIMQVSNK